MLAIIQKGGIFMLPLLLCSFAAVFIFFELLLFFISLHRKKKGIASEIARKVPSSGLGLLLKKSVFEQKEIEEAGSRAIDQLALRVERLEFLASVATLLGLTGTVSGIIKTFLKVQEMGSRVNIALLAGGIWEALLTTLFGLCIAIFSITAYFFLSQELGQITILLERDMERMQREKEHDTD